MGFRTGAMRHRINIEQRHAAKGRMGGASDEWVPVAKDVAAGIEPLSGRELYTAQQNKSDVTVRIRIRYREGITAAMRAVHGSDVYSILYVINTGMRNVELQLMCSIGVNQG